MDDYIEVMLPVTVPNSIYCFEFKKGIHCKYLSCNDTCSLEFKPQRDDYNIRKPLACRSLTFKENVK